MTPRATRRQAWRCGGRALTTRSRPSRSSRPTSQPPCSARVANLSGHTSSSCSSTSMRGCARRPLGCSACSWAARRPKPSPRAAAPSPATFGSRACCCSWQTPPSSSCAPPPSPRPPPPRRSRTCSGSRGRCSRTRCSRPSIAPRCCRRVARASYLGRGGATSSRPPRLAGRSSPSPSASRRSRRPRARRAARPPCAGTRRSRQSSKSAAASRPSCRCCCR
mmetsp:Transcript_15422/g.41592  ORF Transcript_15422/g.41592 Transcript_15422/m.41592 type:complete len:221 (+) Transcript_15422:800-1462(+)